MHLHVFSTCMGTKLIKAAVSDWLVIDGSLYEGMLCCCCDKLGIWMEKLISDVSWFSEGYFPSKR